jgi:cephalosporin-C deacetylase-like acetyl esterase
LKSRREFIQASSALLTVSIPATGTEQPKAGDAEKTSAIARDYWNDLPNYFIAKVNAARAKRKSELARVKSAEEANARASFVRTKVWDLIGGELEKAALNATTTGTIERGAYRIEKVIFESQPKFYVTAHLYIPKSGNQPFPGILAPLGHSSNGKAYTAYQTVFQNLARRGFAVLAWDPPGQGERLQYIDPSTNRSRYGPTGEHDRFGLQALLIGSTTTQFEVWDGIRALDYLLSRPEIDAKRIGCCGHSGGGTQTMFLCALEPRISAAIVVEGNSENLAGPNYQPPGAYADAEQNLIGGLTIPLDRGDLLCAFAPKPLLVCYTPIDAGTTYSPTYIEGTMEVFDELSAVYRASGAHDKVALFASPLPHDYDYFNRQATYRWFGKWLQGGQPDAEEAAFDDAPEESLWCTPTGQVLSSPGGRAAFQINLDRLHSAKRDAKADRREMERGLREVLALPSESKAVQANVLSRKTQRDVVIEEIEFRSESGIRVPCWFLKASPGSARMPAVVMAQAAGKDALFEKRPVIERLVRAGVSICSVDLRTCGVTRPHLPSAAPLFYGDEVNLAYSMVGLSVGSPILGQQVWDLLKCLDYLESRDDVDNKRIGVFASGMVCLPALLGTALDRRVRSALLDGMLADFESVVASKDYVLPLSAVAFGFLRRFDLPEICASIAPRPMWLANTVGPQGKTLPLGTVYRKYNASETKSLYLLVKPDAIDTVINDWAQKALV